MNDKIETGKGLVEWVIGLLGDQAPATALLFVLMGVVTMGVIFLWRLERRERQEMYVYSRKREREMMELLSNVHESLIRIRERMQITQEP